MGLRLPDLSQCGRYLFRVLHGAVVAEVQLRNLTHPQPGLEMKTDESRGGAERVEGLPALVVAAEDADIDTGGPEVRRDVHVDNAHESNPRILDLAPDDIGELLLEKLTDLECTSCHVKP